MANILTIQTSPQGDRSVSRKLAASIVDKIRAGEPGSEERIIDLVKNPIPHLDGSHLGAFFTPPDKHSEADKKAIAHSNQVVQDVMWANTIVIGVPMMNFGIPSTLKSWVDHLARAGITFRYTEKGPEGLVLGKKVYLAISSGGVYSAEPMKSLDFTENYLRAVLGFFGMRDVTVVRAEGVQVPGLKETALEKAVSSIRI